MQDNIGLKTPNYLENEKLLAKDLALLSELSYKNFLDSFLLQCSELNTDSLISGFQLLWQSALTCSLKKGAAVGYNGRYFDSDGTWGYVAETGAAFLVLSPVETSIALSMGSSQQRVDIVEVRPKKINYSQQTRDFRDPNTGDVTQDDIYTQVLYGFEYQIKMGTPGGVAPLCDAGWIKIAEVTIPALATTISQANIVDVRSSSTWTSEASRTVQATSTLRTNWGVDDILKENAKNIPLGADLSSLTPAGGTTTSLDKSSNVWQAIQALFSRLIDLSGVQSGAVLNRHLATDAVSTLKILNDAVTTLKIINDAITTPKIVDGAVTTPKILDAAVTNEKIVSMLFSKLTGMGTNWLASLTDSTANGSDHAIDAATLKKVTPGAFALEYLALTTRALWAAKLLADLRTVDGPGSDLDADKLDGHQPGHGGGLDADTLDGHQPSHGGGLDADTVDGLDFVNGKTGSYGAQSISPTGTWVIPAGTYMMSPTMSSTTSPQNQARLEIYSGSSWVGEGLIGGLVISDGSNFRVYNYSSSTITVYYRKLA